MGLRFQQMADAEKLKKSHPETIRKFYQEHGSRRRM
jgi:hypothetical protein